MPTLFIRYCLVALCLFFSCQSQKKHQKTSTQTANHQSIKDTLSPTLSARNKELLNVKSLKFKYFTTRIKIKYHDNENSFSATASVRMAYDSLLWISVQKLGVEILRCRFSPDSANIADSYNRTYYRQSYPALSQQLGVPISFDLLQALLLGNLPIPHSNNDSIISDSIVIQPLTDDIFWRNTLRNGRPSQLILRDTSRQSELNIILQSPINTEDDITFFTQKQINIKYNTANGIDLTDILLEHTRTEWPTIAPEFPFRNYTNYKQVIRF